METHDSRKARPRAALLRRALTALLGAVSVLHVVGYGLISVGPEWVGVLLGLAGGGLALRVWRTASPAELAVLGLLGLAQAVAFVLFLAAAPLPLPLRPLLVLTTVLYAASPILLIGLVLPRPDAGSVVLLTASVIVGALLLEAGGTVILARQPGSLRQNVGDPEHVIRYRGDLVQDPEMGAIPTPYSVTEKIFPDNERGYFWVRDGSWQLSNQPSSEGTLELSGDSVSVLIGRADDPTPWHVQLVHNGLAVSGNKKYTLRFRIRAAKERPYSFAVGMDHEPWESLGLYETAEAGTDWAPVERTFTVTESDDEARIHFDLGGDTTDVFISDVVLAPSDGGPRVETRFGQDYYVAYEWNSRGCRAPEYAVPPAPNTFRILALGDSYVQGSGVHIEDLFTSIMERLLRERAARRNEPRSYEVIGCGVAGFSTREERLYYEARARAYRPDLVLVAMVSNDSRGFQEDVALGYVHTPAKWEYLLHTGFLVQKARHELPEPDFSASMDELARLQRTVGDDGADLAVVVFRNDDSSEWDLLSESADSAATALGFSILDLRDDLVMGDYRTELMVHPLDGHPNEVAHRIAAERIVAWLDREGLLGGSMRGVWKQ